MPDDPLLEPYLRVWDDNCVRGLDLPVTELCPDRPELRERLEAAIAERRQRSGHSETATSPVGGSVAFGPPVLPDLGGKRYVARRFCARGGLGEVFVAHDAEVGREVALKRIQPAMAGAPGARERFVREATLTGRLEHPGIVPVYGVGRDAAGEPFYAMRFIRGQSLRQAMDAFFAQPPRDRDLAFRQLLQRFVSACNAIAFAHSRGILHRDLKPANIMLGPFGETLVVDWGLAKHVDESESRLPIGASPSTQSIPGPDDATLNLTQAGSALGTPAFMSPEQADGRWADVGPSADVFALGATLYSLLTGQVPYSGANALANAREARFVPPRRIRPDVPLALEAICLKAMSPRPENRYSTVLELATDVERWLADEPVSAFREPLRARVRRWIRQHRSSATLLLGVIATGVIALAVTAILLSQAQTRTAAALEQSRGILDKMLARVGEDEAWLRQSPRVNGLRLRLMREALSGYRELLAQRPNDATIRRETAQTLRRAGDVAAELGLTDQALADYQEAEQLFRDLRQTANGDERSTRDLADCLNGEGNVVSDSERLVEAEAKHKSALDLREGLAALNPQRPDLRRDVARSLINIGNVTRKLGPSRAADTERTYRQAAESCRTLVAATDSQAIDRRLLALALNNLGLFLRDTDRIGEARASLGESLQMRQALAAEFPENPDYRNDVAGTLGNLALADLRTGAADAALKKLDEAKPHQDAAMKANPDHPTYRLFNRNNLANHAQAAARLGDHATAAAESEKLAALGVSPARDAAEAAAVMLRCVAAAQNDSALSESDRLDRVRRFRVRAEDLVRKAVELGFDPGSVNADFNLANLRDDPEIRALLDAPR